MRAPPHIDAEEMVPVGNRRMMDWKLEAELGLVVAELHGGHSPSTRCGSLVVFGDGGQPRFF